MTDWFEGEGMPEGDSQLGAFLRHTRAFAATALAELVSAEVTTAFPSMGCLLTVEVPGIPASEWPVHAHQLQVLYTGGFLGGYWGCSHLWDDFDPGDPDAFNIDDSIDSERAAELAVDWIRSQLLRPRAVQEWARRWRAPARRWILEDTGTVLGGARPLGRGHAVRTIRI